MRLKGLVLIVAVVSVVALGAAQSPPPAFDVTSVKAYESPSETGAFGIMPPTPGRLRIVRTPLRFILHYAFQVRDHQLIGAPEWADSASFDITATFSDDPPRTEDDRRSMLRALLADRFGLKTHREKREIPIYALVMTRKGGALGPQLVRSTFDCEQWIAEKRPQVSGTRPSPVAPGGRRPVCQMLTTRRFITAGTQTMQQLSEALQPLTGRPVANRTGLAGTFDFDLQWTSGPVAQALGATPLPDDGPSIFAALQEQLGLRLESARDTVDVVVVDAVQRPTPD